MSLLGNYQNDPSQLAQLLQAYQQQNWAPMVTAAQQQQQQQGGMPAAAGGSVPFGFQPPTVPQSQFQPYQMSTGQAYGLNPMSLFNSDVAMSRNLYNSLGQGGTTTPPVTPPVTPPGGGGGGTTQPPPWTSGLPPGMTQDQLSNLQRMLYERGFYDNQKYYPPQAYWDDPTGYRPDNRPPWMRGEGGGG